MTYPNRPNHLQELDAILAPPVIVHYESAGPQLEWQGVSSYTPDQVVLPFAPSAPASSATANDVKLAKLELELERERAKNARKDHHPRSGNKLKRTAQLGVGAVAVVLAANFLNGVFPDGDRSSPPPEDMPTPEVAMSKLDSADNLGFATGEASVIDNASFRFTQCLPLFDVCGDYHAGHDISTYIRSGTQNTVEGEFVSYGVMQGPDTLPIALVRVNDEVIANDLVNPVSTHPVAETQFMGDIIAAFGPDSGIGGAVDIAAAQAANDLRIKTADYLMDARLKKGGQPGDAIAGAIATQARKDILRLAGLLKETETLTADPAEIEDIQESVLVIRNLVKKGRPIAVDFGPNGFSMFKPEPIPEVHYSSWGFKADLNFEDSGDLKVSEQVKATIKTWLDPRNVYVVRHGESI